MMSERPGATALPSVLPIFPLAGVLLLPRGRLPLNIFEPRYLAMTRDALVGERLIGMVQPSDKQALLEAPDLAERARLLTGIVEMAALNQPQDGAGSARH